MSLEVERGLERQGLKIIMTKNYRLTIFVSLLSFLSVKKWEGLYPKTIFVPPDSCVI